MFISTSDSPQGPGILALQHQDFDKRNPKWSLDLRASIRAVRVLDRIDKDEGLGQWTYDPESAGDINGGFLWPRNTRPIPGWAFAWPSLLWGKEADATATGGGSAGPAGPAGPAGDGGGKKPQGKWGGGAGGQGGDKGGSGEIRTNYSGGAPGGLFGGVRTNYSGGTPGAQFGGVRTNFSGGKPGASFTDAPKTKDANAPGNRNKKKGDAPPELKGNSANLFGGGFGEACGVLTGIDMMPVIGDTMDPDHRYARIGPRFPTRDKRRIWPKFPLEYYGIALTSTWEANQIEYFMPTDPRLIAVNRKGDAGMGSWVCDMGDGFKIDPDRCARLQSAFRVVRPKDGCVPTPPDPDRPGKKLNSIAWQLANGHCDGVWGYGLVVDYDEAGSSPVGGGSPATVVATASVFMSGPLAVGQTGDKHRIGSTEDGQDINALHIPTTALFKVPADQGRDAPLEFLGDYITPVDAPLYVPVELRYDGKPTHSFVCGARQGMWRWEAKSYLHSPPTETPPVRPPVPTEGHPVSPPSRPWGSGDDHEAFAEATMQTAFPAVLFRAPDLRTNAAHLRGLTSIQARDLYEWDSFAPMVMRVEAFAEAQAKGWNYTTGQRPCRGRWRGGCGDGGIVFLPPEVSIDDYGSGYAPAGRTRSTGYVVAGPNVYFAAGLPDVVRGDVDTGYRWGASSGALVFSQIGSTGTITDAVTMTAARGLTLDIIDAGLRINNQTDRAGAGVGTVRNTPNAAGGDPAIWIPINVGGTTYGWPLWAL